MCAFKRFLGERFSEESLYNAELVMDFVRNHPRKDKKLTLTHMSEILTNLTSFGPCLKVNRIRVDLKTRPDFIAEFELSKKRAKTSEIVYLNPSQVQDLCKIHQLYGCRSPTKNLDICRMIYQLSTGCRFSNTLLSVKNHKLLVSPHGHTDMSCYQSNRQIPDHPDCFHKVIMESKTVKEDMFYIHPCVFSCYTALKTGYHSSNDHFNGVIKHYFGSEYTSHALRKTIPNLFDFDKVNSGRWKQYSTMKNHYVHPTTRARVILDILIDGL